MNPARVKFWKITIWLTGIGLSGFLVAWSMRRILSRDGLAVPGGPQPVAIEKGSSSDASLRSALAKAEKRYGPIHTEVAKCLSELSLSLRNSDEPGEAVELLRRAVTIYETVAPQEKNMVAIMTHNLARALEDARQLPEAEKLMRRAVDIEEEIHGSSGDQLGIYLSGLGEIQLLQEKFGESEVALRRALQLATRWYPISPSAVPLRQGKLAGLYCTKARKLREQLSREDVLQLLAKAEELYLDATKSEDGLDADGHQNFVQNLDGLATVYRVTAPALADATYRRALATAEKFFGRTDPRLADCLNNFGLYLESNDRLDEAGALFKRLLGIVARYRITHGRKHLHEAEIVNSYGRILLALGKSQVAIDANVEAAFKEPPEG